MNRILFVVSTLKRSGPINQLYYIIENLDRSIFEPFLLTLSPEPWDSRVHDYKLLGIEMRSLKLSRLGGFFLAKEKLTSLISDLQPCLIHTQGIRADSILFSIKTKIPWIVTARNFPFEDYPMKFGKFRGGFMARHHASVLKKCQHVVACSKSIQKQLCAIGVQSFAIPNGVSLPACNFHDLKFSDFEAPIFLTVGSLIPRKNTRLVIQAFCLWKSLTQGNGSLVVLGDGLERKQLERMACGSVHFMGNVSNVADYFATADYFVSASFSEGLPNTVLEALAAGLPAILSNIPPHQEIHNECQAASRLFEVADGVDDLANEFKHAFESFDDNSKDAAIRVAKDCFSAVGMSIRYQQYYSEVLGVK
jgi:glycosyltransferase involved in cell wall biosynthesis